MMIKINFNTKIYTSLFNIIVKIFKYINTIKAKIYNLNYKIPLKYKTKSGISLIFF